MPSCYPRPDRRSPSTLRPLSAELSPLSRADGSASLRAGNTHILCAVHGPSAPRSTRWERHDRGCISVAFSRGLMSGGAGSSATSGDTAGDDNAATANITATSQMKSLPIPPPPGLGATERELERFLRDALSSCIFLERYPRCVIQVVVQIVAADGSVLGSALNCAVLALMDAGVAMRGLPVASTCVVVRTTNLGSGEEEGMEDEEDGSIAWLDPTAEEEAGEDHAIVVMVTDKQQQPLDGEGEEIITSFTFGAPLTLTALISSMDSTRQAGAAMVAFMRLAVEQKVQREVQTLWS